MNRTLRVARVELVSWPQALGWPWGIMALAFLINLVLFAGMGAEGRVDANTGGLLSIYVVTTVAFTQFMTQFFPFAMGMGASRRAFFAATSLLAVAQAVLFGAAVLGLKLVEDATGGWGTDLNFFGIPFLVVDHPLAQLVVYVVPFLFVAYVGVSIGVVLKRWGINGMLSVVAATVATSGVASIFLTWTGRWGALAQWFADQSPVSLFAGWPLLLTLPMVAGSYLVLRRTVP